MWDQLEHGHDLKQAQGALAMPRMSSGNGTMVTSLRNTYPSTAALTPRPDFSTVAKTISPRELTVQVVRLISGKTMALLTIETARMTLGSTRKTLRQSSHHTRQRRRYSYTWLFTMYTAHTKRPTTCSPANHQPCAMGDERWLQWWR
jgi:hypothetical protein